MGKAVLGFRDVSLLSPLPKRAPAGCSALSARHRQLPPGSQRHAGLNGYPKGKFYRCVCVCVYSLGKGKSPLIETNKMVLFQGSWDRSRDLLWPKDAVWLQPQSRLKDRSPLPSRTPRSFCCRNGSVQLRLAARARPGQRRTGGQALAAVCRTPFWGSSGWPG